MLTVKIRFPQAIMATKYKECEFDICIPNETMRIIDKCREDYSSKKDLWGIRESEYIHSYASTKHNLI